MISVTKTTLAVAAALMLGTSAYAQTSSGTLSGPYVSGRASGAGAANVTPVAPDLADPSSTGSITTGTISPTQESSGNVKNPSALSIQQVEGGGNETSANGQ
jgi:hypothetical protein